VHSPPDYRAQKSRYRVPVLPTESNVPVYAWYRASNYARTIAVWGLAGFVLTFGGLFDAVAISTHTRGIWPWQAVAGVIGALFTVAGPALAIGGLFGLLRDETMLMLRADGVVLVLNKKRETMSWRELTGVELEEDVLTLVGEARRWTLPVTFDSKDIEIIAARIPEIQRKALMGIR